MAEITKQEKIDNIYEKIADKTLSLGCLIKYIFNGKEYCNTYIGKNQLTHKIQLIMNNIGCVDKGKIVTIGKKSITKIIGHPVMICDILDWVEEKQKGSLEDLLGRGIRKNKIMDLWQHKKLPIEEQNEDCINLIHSLF